MKSSTVVTISVRDRKASRAQRSHCWWLPDPMKVLLEKYKKEEEERRWWLVQ